MMKLAATFLVVVGCGTSGNTDAATPITCGNATCNANEICLVQCFAQSCSFVPDASTCPSGYAMSDEGLGGQPCCVVQPPPHCVVPAQATQADCAPTGQLMYRQQGDENAPPVFCGCAD